MCTLQNICRLEESALGSIVVLKETPYYADIRQREREKRENCSNKRKFCLLAAVTRHKRNSD